MSSNISSPSTPVVPGKLLGADSLLHSVRATIGQDVQTARKAVSSAPLSATQRAAIHADATQLRGDVQAGAAKLRSAVHGGEGGAAVQSAVRQGVQAAAPKVEAEAQSLRATVAAADGRGGSVNHAA